MKTKKIYRFMAILLLIALVIQPVQLTKVQAAGGAIVTGASGIQYTLGHEYVKQLNINTGNITITDSGYSQVNGSTENWDANEDAYVIKGQGTSTNTIAINTTNYPVTLYLLETQWSGNISLNISANAPALKIVILGDVTCREFIETKTTGSSKQVVEVHGYDSNSKLTAGYLMGTSATNNVRLDTLLIDGINLTCNKTTEVYTRKVNDKPYTTSVFLDNLIIRNSEITQNSAVTEAEGRFYFICVDPDKGSVRIEGSVIGNIALDEVSPLTTGGILKHIYIRNSYISSISFGRVVDALGSNSNIYSVTAENSFVSDANFQGRVDTVSLKNSVLKTAAITNQKLYLDGSTVANYWTSLKVPVYSLTHSSFNSYGTNWVLNQTPTDPDANDLFLKKVRFRDYPNTYILTTFQDGYTSKLLTDENGYLYPYIPKNNTGLQFQVTDEKGLANLGNYSLEFDAITEDDTKANVPTVIVPPTAITFLPYANTEVEYSFNKTDWTSVTTDSSCQFSVVFPAGVKRIYVRHNTTLYSIDIDEAGNPSGAVQVKPEIISQSAGSVAFVKGIEGSIFVKARPVNVGSDLHFQWYKNGNPLIGETSDILTFNDPDKSDEGVYTCNISEDGVGDITASPVEVSVMDGIQEENEFKILAQSANKEVTEDSRAELYVIPNKLDGVSYQWAKNGTDIPGATSGTYEIMSIKRDAEGTYTCNLTKGNEVITSSPIALTVKPNPLSNDVNNLEDAVDTLTAQVNTLQEQLNTSNHNLTALQNTIESLTRQIADLNGQISALQSQVDNLDGNVAELQNQINVLQTQKSGLQADLDNVNTEKAGLQVLVSELTIEVSNKDTLITQLQSLLDNSGNENNELRTQVTALNIQVNSMVIQIETLNAQVTSLASERDSLQDQLDTANATISSLQQQVLDLTSDNDDLRSKLDFALQQILNLEVQVDSLSMQNESLEAQILSLEAQITALQDQLDGTGDDTTGLLQQISSLTAQVNNLIALVNQKDGQISYLNDQIASLNTTITNLQIEVADALESLSGYEGLVLQDKIDMVLSENAQLQNNLSALVQEKNNLLSQITGLNNVILTLQGENASLSQQLQEAGDLINSLQNSLTLEISKSSSLQMQVNTLNGQISVLELQLGQSDSDKDALGQQIMDLQEELANITNQLLVANQTIEGLTRQIEGLSSTITHLQIQIDNALSEMSEYEGNGLLEKIRDIKAKQSKITLDLNEANSLNISLNSQLNTANAQLLSLQQQIDILTGQLNDKDAQITELLALIAQRDGEIGSKNTQIGDLQNQVQTLQAALDSSSGDNDAITKLTQQVDDLASQVTELTGKIADKDAQINVLNQQLDAKNAEINDLQKQVEALKDTGSSQTEVTVLEGRITDLTDKLANADDVIKDLQKQLEELKQNPAIVVYPGVNIPENPGNVPEESNELIFSMDKTIYLGYSYRVQISNAEGYKITYESSDNSVARVDQYGVITSLRKGKATITCKVGSTYTYKIAVTAVDGEGKATLNLIPPTIQSSCPVLLMYKQVIKGSNTQLRISGLDDNSEVTFVSADSNVAAISKDGLITGISKGSTDIFALVTHGIQHYIYYIKIRVDDGTRDTNMWEYLTAPNK